MESRLSERVERWCDLVGIDPARRPPGRDLDRDFPNDACRPGAELSDLVAWEYRHGAILPDGLKSWLQLSDGLFGNGPLIHPLSAIGPMVPFARMAGLVVQPESWFELGNPNLETVCIDLGYRLDGGDCPVFTSGDDERGSRPRIIAEGFDAWFLRVLHEGGREYWFATGFVDLGDPWAEHRRHVPIPELADWLRPLAPRVVPMIRDGVDDRTIATRFGLSRFDVEAIARHAQHRPPQAGAAQSPVP